MRSEMRRPSYITLQHSMFEEKGEMMMREGRSNDDDAARHANCVVLRMLLMQVTSFLRVITHIMAALLSFAPPSRYLPSIWGDFDDVELVQHECGERFRVSLCDLQLILHPFKPNIGTYPQTPFVSSYRYDLRSRTENEHCHRIISEAIGGGGAGSS